MVEVVKKKNPFFPHENARFYWLKTDCVPALIDFELALIFVHPFIFGPVQGRSTMIMWETLSSRPEITSQILSEYPQGVGREQSPLPEKRNRRPTALIGQRIACLGWAERSPGAPLVMYRQGAGGERRVTRGTQNGGQGRGGGFNCVSLVKGSRRE